LICSIRDTRTERNSFFLSENKAGNALRVPGFFY
jgi:hypothetical protein